CSEGAWFDERIAELRELLPCDGVEVFDDAIHEGGAVVEELRRQGMSTEICRDHFEDLFRAHCFEDADLGFEIQSIAALGFDGCRAVLEKTICKLDVKVWSIAHRLYT